MCCTGREKGLGAAYMAGFAWGRERGYDAVVEMDADGSHAPGAAAAAARRAGRGRRRARLALGHGRRRRRLAVAPAAALPRRQPVRAGSRWACRCGTRPAGYRAYRTTVLDEHRPGRSCFAGVLLPGSEPASGFRLVRGADYVADRERGVSKMSSSIVREALWRCPTVWGTRSRLEALRKTGGVLIHRLPMGGGACGFVWCRWLWC